MRALLGSREHDRHNQAPLSKGAAVDDREERSGPSTSFLDRLPAAFCLLDAEWRDHLWRAKQVAPQPGRNVKLLYRVTY